MTTLFWLFICVVFYTYIGYGILLLILVKIKHVYTRFIRREKTFHDSIRSCTVVIAAFNEDFYISRKIINTLALNYPKDKIKICIVADGSSDNTPDRIKEYPEIQLLYQPERKGKVAAINRAMEFVDSEIVVFTDANTFLNADALIYINNHYSDPNVGGVAGEKRIHVPDEAEASAAGEGFYWKYESKLKSLDSQLNTSVGAAGELFSVRRDLFQQTPETTILDDFMISMRIAQRGYKIVYEPNAYATETSSSDIKEELKRKIRIAAGGVQSIIIFRNLLNPFRYPLLSFQFISHRVLRWTISPILLIMIFLINIVLLKQDNSTMYVIVFCSQLAFYSMAALGFVLEKQKLKVKIAFIPFYFCVMNYAVIAGIVKYFRRQQSSVWERSVRKEEADNNMSVLN